jgi:hypothetical protein
MFLREEFQTESSVQSTENPGHSRKSFCETDPMCMKM